MFMNSSLSEGDPPSVAIIGARSNLTLALQSRTSAIVISTAEMLDPNYTLAVPKNIPIIINAFQPATQLSNFSDPTNYLNRSLMVLAKSLEQAKVIHPSKIIYTSSAAVYGENSNCREEDAVQTLSLHSALKATAEQMVSSFASQSGIDYTIVRLFNLYGGADRFSVIYRLLKAANMQTTFTVVNSGTAVRDFTHVSDAANTYMQLLAEPNVKLVNVGSGNGTTVAALLDVVSTEGIILRLEHCDRQEIKASVANTERLKKIIEVRKFNRPLTYLQDNLKH